LTLHRDIALEVACDRPALESIDPPPPGRHIIVPGRHERKTPRPSR